MKMVLLIRLQPFFFESLTLKSIPSQSSLNLQVLLHPYSHLQIRVNLSDPKRLKFKSTKTFNIANYFIAPRRRSPFD